MSFRNYAALAAAISCVASLNSAALAGKLMISEILADEVGSDFRGEFIEIYNGFSEPIDLSNYKIGDEETRGAASATEGMFQFPAGAIIQPGELQIIASTASVFKLNYGITPTYEAGSTVAADNWVDDPAVANMSVYTAWDPDGAKLNMANGEDQVAFLDEADNVIDQASWGTSTFFFNPAMTQSGGGQSYERVDLDAEDTNTAADWRLAFAPPVGATWTSSSTPGARPIAAVSTWIADGDGTWTTSPNWQNDLVPNSAGQQAIFGDVITADRTVSFFIDQVIGSLKFDSAFTYTLDGTNRLTFASGVNNVGIEVVRGTQVINVPVTFTRTATLNVADGATLNLNGDVTTTTTINKSGAGRLNMKNVRSGNLNVQGGSLVVTPERSDALTNRVTGLTIAAGASFDIGNNALVVDYATTATTSPLAAIGALIADGRLTSSIAQANPRYSIATADSAAIASLTSFGGETLDTTAVVARVALKGDADISGTVNFADLVSLAQNYNLLEGGTWAKGDSNYDGIVNFADLVSLAQNYNQSEAAAAGGLLASSFGNDIAADWAAAQALVPEPTVVLSALLGTSLLGRRRR